MRKSQHTALSPQLKWYKRHSQDFSGSHTRQKVVYMSPQSRQDSQSVYALLGNADGRGLLCLALFYNMLNEHVLLR